MATPIGNRLPFLSRAPGPTATTLASLSFSTLDSGRKMPLAVFVSALIRWTRTRSRRGARARMDRIEVACSAQFGQLESSSFSLLHRLHVLWSIDPLDKHFNCRGSDAKCFSKKLPLGNPPADACGKEGKGDARTIVIELCEIEIARRKFVES